jgi:hypothetical protein
MPLIKSLENTDFKEVMIHKYPELGELDFLILDTLYKKTILYPNFS